MKIITGLYQGKYNGHETDIPNSTCPKSLTVSNTGDMISLNQESFDLLNKNRSQAGWKPVKNNNFTVLSRRLDDKGNVVSVSLQE